MSKDALDTLGTIIGPGHGRDAVHVAVIAAYATQQLRPGEHVGFIHKDDVEAMKADDRVGISALGIVDPFLVADVEPGQRFWLFLYPRKITGLRHVWTHPEIPDEGRFVPYVGSTKEESEAWLCNFVSNNDLPDYDETIAAASGEEVLPIDDRGAYEATDHYLTFFGRDAHCDIPSEFWDHLENVKGKKLKRIPYFGCSC